MRGILICFLLLFVIVQPSSAIIKACLACNASCGIYNADMSWNVTYPLLDGSRSLTGIWDAGGYNMSNLADPVVDDDAATKVYVDNAVAGAGGSGDSTWNASYPLLDGSRTLTGKWNAGGYNLSNVGNPVLSTDAANKAYVDSVNSSMKTYVDNSNTSMKDYVDGRTASAVNDSYYPRDASVSITGTDIYRNTTGSNLNLYGGSTAGGKGGIVSVQGKDLDPNEAIVFYVPDMTFAANLPVAKFIGGVASPYLHMNSKQIKNLANPTDNQDAATKFYVDAANTSMKDYVDANSGSADMSWNTSYDLISNQSQYVIAVNTSMKNYVDGKTFTSDDTWNATYPLLDGTRALTGVWDMGGYNVSNVSAPVLDDDACTKGYVDSQSSTCGGTSDQFLWINGSRNMSGSLNMSGYNITQVKLIVAGSDVTNKSYVDSAIAGVSSGAIYGNASEVLYNIGGNTSTSPCMAFNNATGKFTACYLAGDGTDITNVTANANSIDIPIKEGGAGHLHKGQAVYISGSSGSRALVLPADNTVTAKTRVVGLVTTDLNTNAAGYVRRNGELSGVDTRPTNLDVNPLGQTWVAGDLLFATTNGGMTNVRPTSGRSVKAAYTIKGSSASDILLAYPMENPVWVTAASGENVTLRLGDNDGTDKVSVRSYANTEVAYVDSFGRASFNGTNMQGRNVSSVGEPKVGADAANKTYVDTAVAGAGAGDTSGFPFLNGTRTLTGKWNFGNYNLSAVGEPKVGADAANKTYVDTADAGAYLLDGTRLVTGDLDMSTTYTVVNLKSPVDGLDAVNLDYLDAELANYLPIDGTVAMENKLNMSGHNVSNVLDPVAAQDAVTKKYLQDNYDTSSPILFYAHNNSINQGSVTNGVKVKYTTETYDTGGYYDTTNSQFLPLTPGYYLIHGQVTVMGSNAGKIVELLIFKNNAAVAISNVVGSGTGFYSTVQTTSIIYLDGVDDYVDIRYGTDDTARTIYHVLYWSYFEGYKI